MRFVYEAVGKSGRVVTAKGAAPSEDALLRELANNGLSLINVRRDYLGDIAAAMKSKRLKRAVLIDIFGYAHGLQAMGMDVPTTWRSIEESIDNATAKEAIVVILDAIRQGFTLTEALERSAVFPPLVLGNVKAGEAAGKLEVVFQALEKHYREEQELTQQVLKATLYPLISVVVLFFIAVGLLTFVIPQLKEIFPPNPPLPTKILVWASNGAVGFWWLVPFLAAGLVVAWLRMPDTAKTRAWEALYGVPLIGPLLKNLALCNMFFNFSLMLGAGVSITQALEAIVPTIESQALKGRLKNVLDMISKGGTFSDGFRDPFFPAVIAAALKQGETTGNLDVYLQRIALFLRERARARMHTLATFIEPLLLVAGGGMVLFLAIGIFLPIYGQMKGVGGK